jgi:hypothetical protein
MCDIAEPKDAQSNVCALFAIGHFGKFIAGPQRVRSL